MVNKERVQLLVDALRSGEFRQTKERLRACLTEHELDRYDDDDNHEYGYCCLGVAVVVAARNGLYADESSAEPDFDTYTDLPNGVRDWYGFTAPDPVIDSRNEAITAIRANDKLGWDFNQIADAFEARYITEAAT